MAGNFWDWFTGKQPTQQTIQQTNLEPHHATSKKKLGFGILLFILINSILGSSLFYLPGLGVQSSGAASIIAWVTLFILATFFMLYISELITLYPTSGGTYEYCKRAYGRFGSFIAGWTIWIAGNFAMALNLVAAAQYFIPEQGLAALYLQIAFTLLWIFVLSFMAFRGIDAGSTMLFVFGTIATIVVFSMIIPSFIDLPALFSGSLTTSFKAELLQPFFQHQGTNIIFQLLLSIFLISEAFFGFEALTYMANEAREPKKLHKVVMSGIIICGIIMTIYILSSLGTVPFSDYVKDLRPFAVQGLNTLGVTGKEVIVFGMYLVIVGAAAAWPIAGSRLLQAMARDKLFVKHLALLHPKHKSPHRAVYFQTIMVALFSGLVFWGEFSGWADSYRSYYLIYVLLSLFVLAMILYTVPILRRKDPNAERPYKAPLPKLGPTIYLILAITLVVNWIYLEGAVAWTILSLAGSLLFLGLPFYFMVEMFYNPEAIKSMTENLANVNVLSEKIFFPFSIRNKLFKNMDQLQGKFILEYGCSIGLLTQKLAPLVQKNGAIYATDISAKKIEIAKKSLQHHPHVHVIHEPHLDSFPLKLPHKVDGIISVGTLSYMQKPLAILTQLSQHLKKGGEIIFVDFDKFFFFFPNVDWIEGDQQLQALFARAGFNVQIERKRSIFWQYIIITGYKG